MKKGIKVFTSGADKAGDRFPLNSFVIVLNGSIHKVGTLVDKTGITANTTAQDLINSPTAVEWLSELAQLTYISEQSSLQIKL